MELYQSSIEKDAPLQNDMVPPRSCVGIKKEYLYIIEEAMSKPDSYHELNKIFDRMMAFKIEMDTHQQAELKNSFNKAIDTLIPNCTRKILSDCIEKKGFFEVLQEFINGNHRDGTNKRYDPSGELEFCRSLNFTNEQKLKALQYGEYITGEAQKIKLSLVDLLKVKREIYKKTQNLNKMMYSMQRLVTPEQMAKIFIFESSRMKREEISVRAVFHLNYEEYDNPEDDLSYYREILGNNLAFDHDHPMRTNALNFENFQGKREARTGSRHKKEERKSLEI